MDIKEDVKVDEVVVIKEVTDTKEAKQVKEKQVKDVKAKEAAKPQTTSTVKTAFTLLKGSNSSCIGLYIAILGFALSLFVMLATIVIKAQTGFIIVALVMLVTYMIVFAILALILNFTALAFCKNSLKKTCSLIGFIMSIISVLLIVGSVLIVYLT